MAEPLQRIDARLLIPGAGDPLRDASLIVQGGKIDWIGPAREAPDVAEDARVFSVPVLMPGMWDCHTHFTGLHGAALDNAMHVPMPVAVARCVGDASRALDAGFTSVREVGGYGVYLARVIEEGAMRGPHVYAAGDLISQTGGHADLHSYSLGCVADYAARDGWLHTCDGEAECLRAVRLQLRRNAKLIKVCASGGVLTEYDDPRHQQFTDRELRVIVEEAARADRIVAAHCHGKAGIMAALRAGVHTIEHGTYLDEEAAAAMKEAGAILVTTRFTKVRMRDDKHLPAYAAKKLAVTADRHREAVELAIRNGVTIASGTDTITSGTDTALRWGLHAWELVYLVEAGMTPLQAIEAATATAPQTLGPQAPRAGRLEAGWDADLCALSANPLDDIKVLADPGNVSHVWKSGRLEKQPAS
ncbi:MAG: amidohydrolase family protein [Gammaproteobacteria bacterium]|nr:amidohydrolase family protein [Gammaproteobacteria bacterium]